MNIYVYVVSNVWLGEGSTVVGAGVDLASAQNIADRMAPAVPDESWAPWTDPNTGLLEGKTLSRIAQDGHGALLGEQEIVVVPLAGMPDVTALLNQEALASGGIVTRPAEPVGDPVGALIEDSFRRTRYDALNDAIRVVERAKVIERQAGLIADEVRVGTGGGRAFFQRAADAAPRGFDGKPWPAIGSGESICGLPIRVDPEMPPDMIRIGTVVYKVGTGANGVDEGHMIRYDEAALRLHLDFLPYWAGFTSPPS